MTDTQEIKMQDMKFTDYYLVVPYNTQDLNEDGLPIMDEETGLPEMTTNWKEMLVEGTKTYDDIVEELRKFCIKECNVDADEFNPKEVEAMVLKMGIWNEKVVVTEINGEEKEMTFIAAHNEISSLMLEESIQRKVAGSNGEDVKAKRIKFTQEENIAGQHRSMSLMPATLQTV